MSNLRKKRRPAAPTPSASADKSATRFSVLAVLSGLLPILLAWGLLSTAVWVVYSRAVHAPFIFDDLFSVQKNSSIVNLWPLVGEEGNPGPVNPPNDDCPTAGRQLVNLSLALNYHFGRLDPFGYHVFNIVVHLLSTVLLWAIVARSLRLEYFGGRFDRTADPLALLVALVWALHPLQTESVVYVSQRTESMMGLCYLATLYGSLRYWAATATVGQYAWLVLSSLACLLGMACKEVMVSAPVMVLLFERTFLTRSLLGALRKSWPLYVGLALGWILLWELNHDQPRSATAGFDLGVPAHVWWFTQTKILWMYLKLVVWPWPLMIHYEMPYLDTIAAAWPWVLATTLLGIATLALLWRRSSLGYLGAWVFAILSPTLVVPITLEMAAERRMYLPLAALAALAIVGGYRLAQGVTRFAEPDASRTASPWYPLAMTTVCALMLAAVLGLVDVRRLAAYQDELTIWQGMLTNQPKSATVHFNLGIALMNTGRPHEAIERFEQALQLKPDDARTQFNLGLALTSVGRSQEAIAHCEQALQLRSVSAEAQNNLGVALMNVGRLPEAADHFEEALRLKPKFAEAHSHLGIALAKAGRADDAIAHFEQALRLQPDYLDACANLTMAYSRAQRSSEAIAMAEKALKLARSQGQMARARQLASWLTV